MCTHDAVGCGGLGWAELTTDIREIIVKKKNHQYAGSGVGWIWVAFVKRALRWPVEINCHACKGRGPLFTNREEISRKKEYRTGKRKI